MSDFMLEYKPPGPVATAWIMDTTSLFPGLMGPVGSGKTTAAIFKRMAHAVSMPVCRDGVRRSKWVHLHRTFRTLEKTFLASWLQWFPKDRGEWLGGNDRPATHTLRFNVGGVLTEVISEFRGLNDQSVEEALRGWEGDGAHLIEMDQLDETVPEFMISRLALRRYPARALLPDGAVPPVQLIGDFNAPDVDNWTYRDFVETIRPGYKLYRQPGGLDPAAENRARASLEDYQRMAAAMQEWQVRRLVNNEFGYSRDGAPVYPEFSDRVHVAAGPIKFDPALPLKLGLDCGMQPAAVICQQARDGQIRVLRELVPAHGCGATRFAETLAALIERDFPGWRELHAWGDPAAQYGADREAGEQTTLEIIGRILGVAIMIPFDGSNEIAGRLEAVRQPLATRIDGRNDRPGLILDPSCKVLIKGFASHYRYTADQKRPGVFSLIPDKSMRPFADVHDALQYACGGIRGRLGIVRAALAGGADIRRMGGWGQRAQSSRPKPGSFDVFRR